MRLPIASKPGTLVPQQGLSDDVAKGMVLVVDGDAGGILQRLDWLVDHPLLLVWDHELALRDVLVDEIHTCC